MSDRARLRGQILAALTCALVACGTPVPGGSEGASTVPAPASLPATATASVSPPPSITGSLAGHVRFHGEVPPPITFRLGDVFSPECGVSSVTVVPPVEAGSHGVRDAFVVVEAGGSRAATPVEVHRSACEMSPAAQLASPDSPITFVHTAKTEGGIHDLHHVLWKLPNGDLGDGWARLKESRTVTRTSMGAVGLHRFWCIINGWEVASVFATKSPYAAVTDDHGAFRIDGIPAGSHAVRFVLAWLPRSVSGLGTGSLWLPSSRFNHDAPRSKTMDLSIAAGSVTTVDVDLGDVAPETKPALAPADAAVPERP